MIEGPGYAAALNSAVALWRSSGGRLSLARMAAVPEPDAPIDLSAALGRDDPNAAVRALVRDAARAVPGSEPVLIQGPPGPAACAWAEGTGVDLIVLGAAARAGDADDDLAEHLLAHAPCPVLVVRPPRPVRQALPRPTSTLAGASRP